MTTIERFRAEARRQVAEGEAQAWRRHRDGADVRVAGVWYALHCGPSGIYRASL